MNEATNEPFKPRFTTQTSFETVTTTHYDKPISSIEETGNSVPEILKYVALPNESMNVEEEKQEFVEEIIEEPQPSTSREIEINSGSELTDDDDMVIVDLSGDVDEDE